MLPKGYNWEDLLEWTNYHDEHGYKIGNNQPRLLVGYANYDVRGHKVGHSTRSELMGKRCIEGKSTAEILNGD